MDASGPGFRWDIPARYNVGVDVCDRWGAAEPERPAILEVAADGAVATTTFGRLRTDSNRLAGALAAHGVAPGDRVAVLLPQSAAVMVAHAAAYKLGAVALPLAGLFGPEALAYRLADSGARACITDAAGLAKLDPIRGRLPDLALLVSVDGAAGDALSLADLLAGAAPDFAARDTGPDDPALMIYTSGTTGQAKGALHGHRVLLGHMPGFDRMHAFPPRSGDLMWTPSDWAWAGGLLNVLMPSLRHGVPVVARAARFEADAAFRLIERLRITNAFLAPTALRMLRTIATPRERYDLSSLRNVASAGEALGADTYRWVKDALGLSVGEAYGQTECNLVLSAAPAEGVGRA
ncbi:AMP-binding protein, partial [Methylobacterium sp. WL8]